MSKGDVKDQFFYKEDESKHGDDPNKIDRLKMYSITKSKNGKFYQQIGDEFFEIPEAECLKLIKN